MEGRCGAPRSFEMDQTKKGAVYAPTDTGGSQSKKVAIKAKGGRPTKKATQELERRILEVSANLFATQGYAATAMEQIAAECGAGKDTIYRRYPSKSALFTKLVDTLRSQVIDEVDVLLKEEAAPIERLYRFARFLLSVNLRPQLVALNRVALSDAVPSGGLAPTPSTEDPFMIRFAELVTEAQKEGSFTNGDAHFIAEQLLYATSIKPLNATMLGDHHFDDVEVQQSYFDQAWNLFLSGAKPR